MVSVLGRRPVIVNGKAARDRPPTQRGYHTISIPDAVHDQLVAYMKAEGIATRPAAVDRLITKPAIPWDEIESALVEEFGLINQKRIANLITRLKTARE